MQQKKTILRLQRWFRWRRPDSNRCPNIFFKSFLHVYSVLDFGN